MAALDDNEDDEDDGEETEDNQNNDNEAAFDAWVNEHKKTFENKFDYILSVDVKDEATKDYLVRLGYEYKPCLNRKGLNKRGYKKFVKKSK